MGKIAILFCICIYFAGLAWSLENGLARTPQMGWNSWNHFGCGINEDLIKRTANAIATGPLKAAGYVYVNLDDCWASTRNAQGIIVPDAKAFPSGLKALGDYIHSLGLKFGIYSDAGTKTCAGRPGSLGHEKADASQYAAWGVDYLKYDNCFDDGTKPEVRYPPMRDALNATGRPILFSMCDWGVDNVATWAAPVGNSWRTTGDITDNFNAMYNIIVSNNQWADHAGPGGWNDPDMLEVGNGHMSTDEYRTHFSLWALAKAPLLVGCDVTNMSSATIDILTNHEVIAVNQDPLGKQGKRITSTANYEVWAGPLQGKAVAAVLFNRETNSQSISTTFSSIGVPTNTAAVRDLWQKKDLGTFTNSFSATVAPHGVVMVKITWN